MLILHQHRASNKCIGGLIKSSQLEGLAATLRQHLNNPSTNRAQCCLTSVIVRELVFPSWYATAPAEVYLLYAINLWLKAIFFIWFSVEYFKQAEREGEREHDDGDINELQGRRKKYSTVLFSDVETYNTNGIKSFLIQTNMEMNPLFYVCYIRCFGQKGEEGMCFFSTSQGTIFKHFVNRQKFIFCNKRMWGYETFNLNLI